VRWDCPLAGGAQVINVIDADRCTSDDHNHSSPLRAAREEPALAILSLGELFSFLLGGR